MAYKHQTQSYRTRQGIRYVCWQDVCEGEGGDLKATAKKVVAELKAQGRHAFYETHKDGYARVFVDARPIVRTLHQFKSMGGGK